MGLWVGVDVGTSGAKAIVCDERGVVRGRGAAEYALSTPRPGWAEQSPEDWWQGSARAIRGALGSAGARGTEVRGVGLSGQMHSLVCLDAADRVVRPAILWCDQRTAAECAEITETLGRARLIALAANRALTGFTAPKILWLRKHEPENWAAVRHVLVGKDYVRLRLTGARATEVTDASGTLLFDVAARRWSAALIEALGIDPAILPPASESPEPTAKISAEGAAATDLAAGTPVVGGAGDQPAGAVGAGVVRPGRALVVLGTSGVVFVPAERYAVDPEARLHSFCHAAPGRFFQMGVMLAAAGSLRWARDVLAPGESYERLIAEAAAAPAGAAGLVFLPYLSGERTPHDDPDARGVFCGLSLAHGRGHLVRAVLEGVACGLGDMMQIVRALGLRADEAFVSGGGARGDLWCQIVAEVLGAPVTRLAVDEGPALGAALLAAVGTGAFATVEQAAEVALERERERTFEPSADQPLYVELHAQYQALYRTLQASFPPLSRLQR